MARSGTEINGLTGLDQRILAEFMDDQAIVSFFGIRRQALDDFADAISGNHDREKYEFACLSISCDASVLT